MPRVARGLAAAVAGATVLGAVLGLAPAARAAPPPRVLVELADPLQQDPLTVQLAVQDQDGNAEAFTGTVVLAVGRRSSSVRVAGDTSGIGTVSIPTSRLPAGVATLTATVTAGHARTVVRLPAFTELAAGIVIGPYSCAVVRPGGGPVRWAVTSMNGEALRTPESRDVPLLPYVPSSSRRWEMVDDDWRPLATSGVLTIRQGSRTVATRRLPKAVRRLVFGSTWDGRVGGAFRPGVYTASLVLTDAAGRPATATQSIVVAAAGAATACGV